MPKTKEKDNLFKLVNKKPIIPSNKEIKKILLQDLPN